MAKKSNPSKTEWADILGPARDFEAAVTKTRSLYDLPLVADGAKEIALLSIFKEEQRFAFEPVMRALQRLSQLTDWSHSFFVCDRVESEFFDWRKMPLRQYSSFQDFYHRELEATWGKWESLQHTYAQIVRGEITEADAQREIEERVRRVREADAKDQQSKKSPGGDHRSAEYRERVAKHREPTDLFDTQNNVDIKNLDVNSDRPTGNSETYALRKLRKDRPDIHARVLNGELSAHAGMIEAKFRNKQASRKMTALDQLRRWWKKASEDERATFLSEIE